MPSTKRSKTSRQSSSKKSAETSVRADEVTAAVSAVMPEIVKLVLSELDRRRGVVKGAASRDRHSAPSADIVFDVAQRGSDEELRTLLDLPIDALRVLVAELALDASSRTRKWSDRARLRGFVVEAVMARVHRQKALLKPRWTGHTGGDAERALEWESFNALVDDHGRRASAFVKLLATPRSGQPIMLDGDAVPAFGDAVVRCFDVELRAGARSRAVRSDAIELVSRDASARMSRHWLQGADGAIGLAETIESPHAPGQVSLWDVALDCLRFMRLVGSLASSDVHVRLEFQPGNLVATPGSLVPGNRVKVPLPDMPLELRGPDSANGPRIGAVDEDFTLAEVRAPFIKLAQVLHHRWRVIYDLHELRVRALAEALERLAESELRWSPMGGRQKVMQVLHRSLEDPLREVRIGVQAPPQAGASIAVVRKRAADRSAAIAAGERVARVFDRSGVGGARRVYEAAITEEEARALLAQGAQWDGPEEYRPR